MIFKRKYLFTSRKTSYKGIASFIAGALSLVSFIVIILIVLKNRGNADLRLGATGFVSCVLSAVGLITGIVSLVEKDTFRLFPRLGTFVSFLALILWGGVMYVGINGGL